MGVLVIYPQCPRSTKLPVESAFEFAGKRRFVRVGNLDHAHDPSKDQYDSQYLNGAFARLDPRVLVRREHAQHVVVLVHRFAKISALLLVPPVGVWIAKLPLDSWGIDVAAVLSQGVSNGQVGDATGHSSNRTISGSSASLSFGYSGYFSSVNSLLCIWSGMNVRC